MKLLQPNSGRYSSCLREQCYQLPLKQYSCEIKVRLKQENSKSLSHCYFALMLLIAMEVGLKRCQVFPMLANVSEEVPVLNMIWCFTNPILQTVQARR